MTNDQAPLARPPGGNMWRSPWRPWFLLVWLVWLFVPVSDAIATERPIVVRIVLLLAVAVFIVCFASLMLTVPFAFRHRVVLSLTASSIGFVTAITCGQDWLALLVFATILSIVGLPERLWLPSAFVHTGFIVAVGLIERMEVWTVIVMAMVTATTSVGIITGRRNSQLSTELEDVRAELTRVAVTEERLRFARDLHDLIGHNLSVIALKAQLAQRIIHTDAERAGAELADIEKVARTALVDVRQAVTGYRQMTLSDSLAGSRATLLAAGIRPTMPAELPDLPSDVEDALAWVLREGTTNVLRHSGARNVAVIVGLVDGAAFLTLADDGGGGEASERGAGNGLRGMEERVAALDGELEAGCDASGGFRVRAEVPLPAAQRVDSESPT